MKKTIELIEKLLVPIILGVLVFITNHKSNEILYQQTQLDKNHYQRSHNNKERQLELKYLELFYSDIKKAIKCHWIIKINESRIRSSTKRMDKIEY